MIAATAVFSADKNLFFSVPNEKDAEHLNVKRLQFNDLIFYNSDTIEGNLASYFGGNCEF